MISLFLIIIFCLGVQLDAAAKGRIGSKRIGGYTASGKGSHYIGGYNKRASSNYAKRTNKKRK